MAWEMIVEEWNESVSFEAIKEAVQLASQDRSNTQTNLYWSRPRREHPDENIPKSQLGTGDSASPRSPSNSA